MKSNMNYNCYGYALGIEEWLDFGEDLWKYWACGMDKDKQLMVFKECASRLIEKFQYREIKVETDPRVKLSDNRYLFGFRLAEDDFHFVRRTSNNHWYHKRGWKNITTISFEEVLSDCWNGGYDSPIMFFSIDKASSEWAK